MKIDKLIRFLESFREERKSVLNSAEYFFLGHIAEDLKANDLGSALIRIYGIIESGQNIGIILDDQVLKTLMLHLQTMQGEAESEVLANLTEEGFAALAIRTYLILLNSRYAQTTLRPVYLKVRRGTHDNPESSPITWCFEEVWDKPDPFIAFTKDERGFLFPSPMFDYAEIWSEVFPELTEANYATVKPNIKPKPIRKRDDGMWEIAKEIFREDEETIPITAIWVVLIFSEELFNYLKYGDWEKSAILVKSKENILDKRVYKHLAFLIAYLKNDKLVDPSLGMLNWFRQAFVKRIEYNPQETNPTPKTDARIVDFRNFQSEVVEMAKRTIALIDEIILQVNSRSGGSKS